MSKSFALHYHSYRYVSAALIIFLFAFAIIYNLVAGFLSDGTPVGLVVMQDGEEVESDFSLLWLVMHFMMLTLIFIIIVMVSFALDAKHEPRKFVEKPVVSREELLRERKEQARLKLHKTYRSGFSRHHLKESLLEKGHDEKEIERLLDTHRIK